MLSMKYAKAWASAIGGLIAVAGVSFAGGDVTSIPTAAAAISGGIGTLLVIFGPKNGG